MLSYHLLGICFFSGKIWCSEAQTGASLKNSFIEIVSRFININMVSYWEVILKNKSRWAAAADRDVQEKRIASAVCGVSAEQGCEKWSVRQHVSRQQIMEVHEVFISCLGIRAVVIWLMTDAVWDFWVSMFADWGYRMKHFPSYLGVWMSIGRQKGVSAVWLPYWSAVGFASVTWLFWATCDLTWSLAAAQWHSCCSQCQKRNKIILDSFITAGPACHSAPPSPLAQLSSQYCLSQDFITLL